MPKYAISNGFCIGELPVSLWDMTCPERFLTQLVSVVAFTRVMRGGKHRCIRSHCMAFDATPCPPVCMLPRSICNESTYRVVLAGEMTELQNAKIRKMHQIRQETVKKCLTFYKTENHFFSNIVVDTDTFEGNSDRWGQVNKDIFSVADAFDEQSIDAEGEAPTSNSVVEFTGEEDEERRFLVRHSSRFSKDENGELYGRMFPHLFPFGRGHPGDERKYPVSHEECVRHYLLLSSRRFAEDELFSFVAFDRVGVEKMYLQTALRCSRAPNLFDGFHEISEAELKDALEVNEERRQGRKPSRHCSASANRFLKSVEISSSAVWGSAAERRYYRQQAFAYQTRYGQPTLFVTITPNSDNSFVTVHYAGSKECENLWDCWLATLPTRIETRKATMGDDAASGRLFMRQMDAFIEDVLGIDPVTKQKKCFKGLLGNVRAYFGMIETQGRGTLHGHFLIWLSGCPPNAETFEQELRSEGDAFTRGIVDYADSIVTTELPISLSRGTCVQCGGSLDGLIPLPIPVEAHENVVNCKAAHIGSDQIREPLLVRCGNCGAKFSSQHVLRRLILENWPDVWPPPLRPLSQQEILQQANREASCRGSILRASNAVYERESIRNAATASARDINRVAVLREQADMELSLLHYHNNVQAPFYRLDEDPILSCELFREVSMVPPSLDDERCSPMDSAFIVSALALRFNQHWWSHTSSCFKTSKLAGSKEVCRYGFPRERELCSRIDESGFHPHRQIAHEYINGFNPTIMETFRCNHDIQLLLGGTGSTDRIYYCCKYVTKTQKRMDSMAAIALAAFKRREEREQIEMQNEPTIQNATMSRRRVGSMAFNVTNRQEIAGPLAVLYLLHGSCCYHSHNCCQLPLREILKQLKGEGEHSCQLVQRRDSEGDANRSKFRAVSVLDDYLYRPHLCDTLTLYEFVARSYRRRRLEGTNPDMFYLDRHPLSETHCLGMHVLESVPMITGFQIPRWKENAPLNTKENYAAAVLKIYLMMNRTRPMGGLTAISGGGIFGLNIAREIMCNLEIIMLEKRRLITEAKAT
ncbi:hypothetical protein PHMEG_00025393, partial [Phytophthora megakarya]